MTARRRARARPCWRCWLRRGRAAAPRSGDDDVTLRFWGLGREGEVVARARPRLRARRNPGIRVEVQQIPWTAAHEKLLTAYVGDSTPDVAQLGNTWVPEFAALRRARAAGRARRRLVRGRRAGRSSPASGTRTSSTATLYGIPGTSTPACSSTAATCSRDAGYDAPPRTWAEWREAMARGASAAGPQRYGDPAADQRVDAADDPRPAAGSPLLGDGGTPRRLLASPASRRAFDFYVGLFRDGLAPVVSNNQVGNVYQEFARGTSRCTSPGRGTSASSGAACRRRCRTPGRRRRCPAPTAPRRRRRVDRRRRRASSCSGLAATRRRRWKLIEFLSRPSAAGPLLRADRRPAGAARAWDDPALASDPRVRRSASSSSTPSRCPRSPSGSRSPPSSRSRLEAADPRRGRACGGAGARSTPTWTGSSRSGAGCSTARGARRVRRDRRRRPPTSAGSGRTAPLRSRRWSYGRPRPRRLDLSGARAARPRVFFLLPVVAGLVLSFTDFDIYAIGDPRWRRFVGAGNYARLLHDPALLDGAAQHPLLRARRRPAVGGGVAGAALLVNARLARFKGLFRTVYFAPVVTTLVAVAIVWRYLYHPRYGVLERSAAVPRPARRRLARRSALGDAGDHPAGGVEELRLQHGDLHRRAAERFPRSSTRPRASTAPAPGGSSATSRCRCLRRPSCSSALITMIGYFQLFAEPYVMTQGGPLQQHSQHRLADVRGGLPLVATWGSGAAIAFVLFADHPGGGACSSAC